MNKQRLISFISTETVVTCHGIRSLSSFLKKHGHKTQLIFLTELERQLSSKVLKDLCALVADSDLIGISCYSQSVTKAIQATKALQGLGIPLVWGGCHATLSPENCINYVDFVCIGEGEGACLDLVEHLDDNEVLKNTPNLWVKENGKVYKNAPRPLIADLDGLPWEDYDFTNQYYLERGRNFIKYKGQRLGAQSYKDILPKMKRKGFSVTLSRGCPYGCTYCYNYDMRILYRGISQNFLRRKSIPTAIAELHYYKELLGLSEEKSFISFDDDEFFSRAMSEMKEFCFAYRDKIDIPFGCHVHIHSFNEEKLKLLIDAGLKIVTAGIQSGSERINQEIYNRKVSNEKALEVVHILRRYRKYFYMPASYHVINSNPYETEEDVWDTINLINSFPKPFNIQMFQLSLFPNSWLTNKAIADGVLTDSRELAYDEHYYDAISFATRRKHYRYAWFVLNLMVGLHYQNRQGMISQRIFRILANKRARKFFERNLFLVRFLICFLLLDYKYRRYVLPSFLRRHYYYSRYNKV